MSVAAPISNSKGEKAKKFQSLNINTLYQVVDQSVIDLLCLANVRSFQGSTSKPQQRSAPPKHGLQSLGKIPTARRAPANLPSLKAETTGGLSEDSVPAAAVAAATPSSSSAAAAAASAAALTSTATVPSGEDGKEGKSWHPEKKSSFLHQRSPLFGQEFPSLKKGAPAAPPEVSAEAPSDTRYGPGPSLRPQTSGNWMFGGGAKNSTEDEKPSFQIHFEPPVKYNTPPPPILKAPTQARRHKRDMVQPSIIDNEKLKRMDLMETREDDWTKSDDNFDYNKKLAR